MLIFTHRLLLPGTDESVFTRVFDPGSTRLGMAEVRAAPAGGAAAWSVANPVADVADGDAINALLALLHGGKPLLVYVHGNSNPPAACFTRCARLAELYGTEVVGFSWASEGALPDGSDLPQLPPGADGDETELEVVGPANRTESFIQRKIRRYHQAKINAQDSVDALARFLRLVGTARLFANAQPYTLAAHSLGAHFLQYALAVPGAAESLGTARNVVLLAPCTRASGHADWLAQIRPRGQLFVTYNRADSVLFGAMIADGGQEKLGTDPGATRLAMAPLVRYISFSNSQTGFGGHSYFALDKMPHKHRLLFARLFGSSPDLAPHEHPRQVYPVGCDLDGVTCYMAAPDDPLP